MKTTTLLLLGAEGMVGRALFNYLKSCKFIEVHGTTRNTLNSSPFLFFDINNPNELATIHKKLFKIDYIINCTGVLRDSHATKELITANSLFPLQLAEFSKKHHIKIIHISTDAVFSNLAGNVTEKSTPTPIDKYGASKYLGELDFENTITIRTSILGLSPQKKSGLLESIKAKRNNHGYKNQKWSGCTTLQFAQFIEFLVTGYNFEIIRRRSPIIHFAPIGPLTKFKIVNEFCSLIGKPSPTPVLSTIKISRYLTTKYFDILKMDNYTNDIQKALKALLDFESSIAS